MLTITGLITLVVILLAIGLWGSALRAKELAIAACKKACKQRNLQFLDGTAHLQKIRLRRKDNGRVRFIRWYAFDYYDGQTRLSSLITIFNNQVIEIDLPPLENHFEPVIQEVNKNNVIQFPKGKINKK